MHNSRAKTRFLAAKHNHQPQQGTAANVGTQRSLVDAMNNLQVNTTLAAAQPTPPPANSFSGFQHPSIQRNTSQSIPPSFIPAHEELNRQFRPLVDIINNKLIRTRMTGDPRAVGKEKILNSNEAIGIATECLARQFSGPFSQHMGVMQVDKWSRADVPPSEYFDIIRESLDRQVLAKQLMPYADTELLDAEPTPSTLVLSNPYAMTPTMLSDFKDVAPLPVNDSLTASNLGHPSLRTRALYQLYAASHHTNTLLQNQHHSHGFTPAQLISTVLDLEHRRLTTALALPSTTKTDREQQRRSYTDAIHELRQGLKVLQTMENWVLGVLKESIEKHATQNTAKESMAHIAAWTAARLESERWKMEMEEMEARGRERRRKNREMVEKRRLARNGEVGDGR
ncbi:hypothetical protein K458DRAFT_408444 [Lentithecium fluviatile CBS 122367]|uniref:Uncharacterized protein n=1 Tax=Lentithecium fluviatile CBS 122367 TaxID=1168545 RepID=A0A6G1ILX9_9PLEO|nr:hypothetical protein K458DRAFT_408444 [Lentithecium fluviatile CBS 122367]